jgi:hypothetical protein
MIPPLDLDSACWLWTGSVHKRTGRPVRMAHKHVWQAAHGCAVPDGMHLHHACENVLCVNPWHLAPITPAEHGRHHAQTMVRTRKATCVAGHDMTDPKVVREYVRPDGRVEHVCRLCSNARKSRS